MGQRMTKSQIAKHLAEKHELTTKTAIQFLDDLAQLAYREAKHVFPFPGIGKLRIVSRSARMGRNPRTGDTIAIPAKRFVRFRIAQSAKAAILGRP